jgi:hypothetical protein
MTMHASKFDTGAVSIGTAAEMISAYLAADIPAFLWGSPGIGKSDLFRMIAAAAGLPLIDFRAILRDPVDLRGLPVVDKEAGLAKWLPPEDLPDALRHGPEGILFLDELNAASPAVQAACFGLVLDRMVGSYRMPAGWRIVAAGNRASDRAAAQRMPTALANRFAHVFLASSGREFVADWIAWGKAAGIHPAVLALIYVRPELLHAFDPKTVDESPAFPSPRQWAKVSRVVDAPEGIRRRLIAGLVGSGAADEFEGLFRLYHVVPGIVATALRDASAADIPADLSARFAVASALGAKATRANFHNVVAYADRLPGDVSVVPVVDAVTRDPGLKETAAFVTWSLRNKHVVL